MSSSKRSQLTQALTIQFRYVSANSVMFSQVVADKVGLHSTDNECLDYLLLNGPSTAGQLSKFTGLTTGAVTAMIDRLEKAGFVRREHDTVDRRKVIVIPDEAKINAEIAPHAMPMGYAMDALCAEYSEDALEIVLDFVTKANHSASEVISKARVDD
ncbi:MAG: MarR family transcriptional regulator [Chloroflexota bacterium]